MHHKIIVTWSVVVAGERSEGDRANVCWGGTVDSTVRTTAGSCHQSETVLRHPVYGRTQTASCRGRWTRCGTLVGQAKTERGWRM